MKTKDYWDEQLSLSKELPLDLSLKKIDFPSTIANLYDVTYTSLYDEKIHGWFIEPKNTEKYPLVVEFIGYMNHLESPLQFMHYLSVGCGVLVTDSRGQGGKTKDTQKYQTYSESRLMACGFLDRDDFYLRRLYWDALRLLDVVQEISHVDKENIFIHGTSQGGGIGLFANSLTPHPIKYGFYDVPSHSNLISRIAQGTGSYQGIHEYLKNNPSDEEKVLTVLDYFDIKHVVDEITNPVLISVGEADPICPKEDFLVAYHKIKAIKELDTYQQPGHGGGGLKHIEKILNYLLKETAGECNERD
ncbi:acetylxylan esterase [Vagococcus hydrophili]|uniref:Acetylxylan esterase n=1 Tax=Vagococcus hydrophili TaxID=2714947 RepID=A0A6G8AUM0_9ENTE|nr:acetylxylan esterase [Vagococcus hydrophili]QIL48754.1 acetylxylan esterase [Vagococcus hydrophili]